MPVINGYSCKLCGYDLRSLIDLELPLHFLCKTILGQSLAAVARPVYHSRIYQTLKSSPAAPTSRVAPSIPASLVLNRNAESRPQRDIFQDYEPLHKLPTEIQELIISSVPSLNIVGAYFVEASSFEPSPVFLQKIFRKFLSVDATCLTQEQIHNAVRHCSQSELQPKVAYWIQVVANAKKVVDLAYLPFRGITEDLVIPQDFQYVTSTPWVQEGLRYSLCNRPQKSLAVHYCNLPCGEYVTGVVADGELFGTQGDRTAHFKMQTTFDLLLHYDWSGVFRVDVTLNGYSGKEGQVVVVDPDGEELWHYRHLTWLNDPLILVFDVCKVVGIIAKRDPVSTESMSLKFPVHSTEA